METDERLKNGCFFNTMGIIILLLGIILLINAFTNTKYGGLLGIMGVICVIYAVNRFKGKI